MSLDMFGTIDDVFQSVPATVTQITGDYDSDGIWVEASSDVVSKKVTVQPTQDEDLDFLKEGAERVTDPRRIYITDGGDYGLSDIWNFDGIDGDYRTFKVDNRPWHNYCRVIAGRLDG